MSHIQKWRGFGLLFLVVLGVCLLGGYALAANFTVAPKVNNVDNVVSTNNTQWIVQATTTADLAPGDIIRFVLPTTTVGSPFSIVNPTSTALVGVTFFKNLGPSPVIGVSSTFVNGLPTFYGFVTGTPITSGTAFMVTFGGVNNASVASTSLIWQIEAGTLSSPFNPASTFSGSPKFVLGASAALVTGGGSNGSASISNVVLADTDTTGFGLDGRDFTVTWTPTSTLPTGYINTQIFIVTSGINLTTTTLFTSGCNGVACQPLGFTNQFNQATNTLMQYMQKDSANASLSTTTQYVAWVYITANQVSLVSSTPASTTYDNIADVSAPTIEHAPVHGAVASTAAVINAFVSDDQTTQQGFSSPTGNIYFKLFYATSTWSPSAFVASVGVAGSELLQFTVPTTSVPSAAGTFMYYLMASDATGNVKLFCANPSAVTSTDCQTGAFVVHTAAAGSRSVAGTISYNTGTTTAPLASAKVFAGGFAKAAATTDGSGNYTISGLPDNDGFDITATKIVYCKNSRFETIGTVNKTGINLNLNPGNCFFAPPSGGGGGGGGAPMVMFSGPPDGMQGVPLGMGIRIGLNQTMDDSTINDADATNAGSNVYLTTDDGTTKIAGSVTFCANNNSPGCSSLFSMDNNTILFTPTGALSSSTFYTLVITEGVKSSSGQSIQGNRAGGGHKVSFTTSGGVLDMGNFGTSGQFMPPYVKSLVPAPGISAAPNTGIVVEFNQAMGTASMNSSNIKLFNITNGANTEVTSGVTITLDSTESRFATIAHSSLAAGTYEVRVLGAAGNASGISMRPPADASAIAFRSSFPVAGSSDATAPTIYPMLINNSTGVAVNNIFQFGFNEQLSFSTINTTNVTLYRGATAAGISLQYDPGANNVSVVPGSVLAPNTVYTLTIGSGVTDLANNALATSTYTYTTGAGDSVAPAFKGVRCDDYTCKISFTEPMNHDAQVDSNYASSTLNHLRFNLTQGGADKITTSTSLTYSALDNSVVVAGVGLTPSKIGGANFSLVISGITDMSGNNIAPVTVTVGGPVEDSKDTFGSFGGGGMFAPPSTDFMGGGGIGGGVFTPQGFGSFTADQFSFGQADMAFPFNPSAGADSNVFQIKFNPGVVVANTDKIVLTLPVGTVATNVAADTFSPFVADYNGGGNGTVTGVVTADSATQVTIALTVSGGTPSASDNYTIDLKKIINPTIPKGPNTGGYTVGIKLTDSAGTTVKANKTSMPYYVMAGGTNNLTINMVAGVSTSSPTSGANGNVFLHGGGPGGSMDKNITLTNGVVSAVDASSTTNIVFNNLNDGCYFFGTDPLATLGGNDYFGQMSPEPACLSGSQSLTKYLLLTPSSAGSGSATVTVKFAGIADFGGADIDIMAGGPGKFVVKTLSAVGAPSGSGYTIKLPANGNWFVGVGPSMPKGASTAKPVSLPGVPPAPIELIVSGLPDSGAVVVGQRTPPSVSFNDSSDTVTFTFASANKTVSGTVKDGSGNGLANMNVFMHRQGFGSSIFGTTNASGTFSLAVSDYGNYEIGVTKDGLPPVMKQIEVRNESGTKIYMDGKLQSSLELTVNKAAYTISGKVLDSSSNGIASAPVFANDTNGNSVFGQTASDGSYTLYVANGMWKVQSQMPSEKSDTCGSFSTTVTVSGSSQSSQNISPSVASCNTLSGTINVGGAGLPNAPLFIEEWNAGSNSPVTGGMKKQASTDSSGAYSVKLAPGTYRLGTWDTVYGELSATKVFSTTSTQDITVVSTSTISFGFTNGTSAMNGMLELRNSTDNTKTIRTSLKGLNSTATVIVTGGQDYNYFADVFGVGKYSGTTTAGAAVTINLGISVSDFITVTGTIYSDVNTSTIAGSLVTFKNTSNGTVQTAVTDGNGQYTVKVVSGTYAMSAGTANYLSTASLQNITFTTTTIGYDFGGDSPDQTALRSAGYTIEGTVSSSVGAAMSKGYVTAQNASGTIVTAPVNADGTYSVPVAAGVWTVKGVGPNHSESDKSGAVTITNTSSFNNSFALTADATKTPTSTNGVMAANAGGSVNDSAASGIKFTVGKGVLETGSGDVNLTLEKNYSAPATTNFKPVGNTNFSISAQGNSTIKDLSGNAEIQLDFSSLIIPAGIDTSSLKLMYFSPESGDYVPVEGGSTVDVTNKTITGLSNHLTDFVIAYAATTTGVPSAPTGVSATVASASQINVSWSAVSGATYYDVHRSTDGTSYTSFATTTQISYSDTGRSASTLYYYKITAWNNTGESSSSDAASATTSATPVSTGGGGGGSYYTPTVVTTTPVTTTVAVPTTTVIVPVVSEVPIVTTEKVVVVMAKPNSKVGISSVTKVSYQPGEVLKFGYAYKNEGTKKVAIKIVRQVLDAKGKVIFTTSGNVTLKPGQTFSKPVAQTLPKTWKPGEYTVKVKITDAKNKLLDDNSFKIIVEKLKKKMFSLGEVQSTDSAVTFDATVLGKIKSEVVLPVNLKVKYYYVNNTATKQTVKMTRTLVNSVGKVVSTKTGRWSMKVGEKDNTTFTQPVAGNLAVGNYTIKIVAKDNKTGVVLAENSLGFVVELK